MPYVKKTENPEIVTPPTPLPVPSPTYETETGERYTAQGEVITAPRNRYTGDTHALSDELYSDHPIYLGKFDLPENYEEGNEADYQEWLNKDKGE